LGIKRHFKWSVDTLIDINSTNHHRSLSRPQELERQENVMVVCHQAVARCLLAYFQDKSSGTSWDALA